MSESVYIIHWSYSDGSGSGVVTALKTSGAADWVMGLLRSHGDMMKHFECIEMVESPLFLPEAA